MVGGNNNFISSDDLLRVKRLKMISDLERRERDAKASNSAAKEREDRIARQLKEEIARIRAMHAMKAAPPPPPETEKESGRGGGGVAATGHLAALPLKQATVANSSTAETADQTFEDFVLKKLQKATAANSSTVPNC